MVITNIRNNTKKMDISITKTSWKGFLAGVFIAIGAIASNVVTCGVAAAGIAKLLSAIVFPIGLILITMFGGELYTGDCLMINAVVNKKIPLAMMIMFLVNIWVMNMAGASVALLFNSLSGNFAINGGSVGIQTIKVAFTKCNLTPIQMIFSGIFCNMLVCAAVLLAGRTDTIVEKIAVIFFPVATFVLCGFEHCVANMYYLAAGLNALSIDRGMVAGAAAALGVTEAEIVSTITLTAIVKNLTFVTIGNTIGGMLFAILIYYLNTKDNK